MSISAGQQRKIQRAVHLATAVVLFTYVYLPAARYSSIAPVVKPLITRRNPTWQSF